MKPADARRKTKFEWERCPKNRAVSPLERLAYKRHRLDLRDGHKRGIYFDDEAGARAVLFIRSYCRHSKGRWAGKPFELSRFQEFVVRSLFGWKRLDGRRRFQFGYLQVARKQGKTTLAAAIALYLTIADHEAGAEVYSAATKKDQARLCFNEAAAMARRSQYLTDFVDVFGGYPQSRTNNISCALLGSKFEPLASDENLLDGLNIHGLIGDELHRWKKQDQLDVLETASGSREQPLRFYITTPGTGEEGVCWDLRDYCQKVLEGVVEDDGYFCFIAEPDKEADFTKPKTWEMGNPNLGVTVTKEDLAEACKRALDNPTKQNGFRRFQCGQWTEQVDRWLDLAKWAQCGGTFDPAILAGRSCYAGLDLATTTDLATLALCFPPVDEWPWWYFLWWAWVPEDKLSKLGRKQRKPYEMWRDAGYLETTPGDVVDYKFIRAKINELADVYTIEEIAFDPWNATALVTDLQEDDGHIMVKVTQGVGGMSAPTKEFERLLLQKHIRHGDNPVARWCASNIAIWRDPNENIKPSRKSSGGRIDLLVAAIIALSRGILEDSAGSVYDKRGLQ